MRSEAVEKEFAKVIQNGASVAWMMAGGWRSAEGAG
jgi:hypothetical protein